VGEYIKHGFINGQLNVTFFDHDRVAGARSCAQSLSIKRDIYQ
jgi:hypothetical protein